MRDFVREMKDQYKQIMDANNPDKAQKVSLSFCPTTWGKPCKLCDACKEILWHKDKHTQQEVDQAGEFNRKPKFYANVILLSNPKEVLLFEYGKTIGDKLGIYEMDEGSELKGFSHPHTGRNIIIVKYPHPDKRKTRYDVEPRIASSPLPDLDVLKKLYNLDDVPALLASGVQPLYQSKLSAQRTEIRWLPSWLGPQFASVFQVRYFIHYHVSEDELAAINRGEINPLVTLGAATEPVPIEGVTELAKQLIQVPQPVGHGSSWAPGLTPPIARPVEPVMTPSFTGWEAPRVPPQNQTPPPQANETRPGCYGTYDDGDNLCLSTCKLGAVDKEGCKAETRVNIEKRRQARGLYK